MLSVHAPVVGLPAKISPLARLLPTRLLAALSLFLLCSHAASAATRYVNGATGNDAGEGLAPAAAWRTLQRACDAAQPGDTVQVAAGVYFEHPRMTRNGTATAPIVFRASNPAAKATIISGANVAIRSGQASWTLEDASLQLYSTPVAEAPAAVLADDVNMFGYVTLGELRTFNVASVTGSGHAAPGPLHGFAWENGRLYVRLSAQYGAINPAQRLMKVSSARGGGGRGDEIVRPENYNWSIETLVPANVVLEGFTFETPGFTGVWIKAGGVTVRGCWFYGCRTGVRGWDHAEERPTVMTDDVTVEDCDYSIWPAYEDVMQVVARAEAMSATEQAALPAFFWWHRKGGSRTDEIGIVTAAGRRWKILGNYVSSCLDAISFMSVGWSEDTEIAYNTFERAFDNAVESENHALRMRVHHNTVIDTFEPFSYQPMVTPYPDDIAFYNNLVTFTPALAEFWKKPVLRWTPGCIKIKPVAGFSSVPTVPMRVYNNTFYFPTGNMISAGSVGGQGSGFEFYNNVVIARGLQTGLPSPFFARWIFSHNVVAPVTAGEAGPGAQAAGSGGVALGSVAALGLVDFAGRDFRLAGASAALGAGVVLPQVAGMSADAGAFARSAPTGNFQSWRFHYFPTDLMDETVSGPNADPDGDSTGNLTEFQAGRNPRLVDGPVVPPVVIVPPVTVPPVVVPPVVVPPVILPPVIVPPVVVPPVVLPPVVTRPSMFASPVVVMVAPVGVSQSPVMVSQSTPVTPPVAASVIADDFADGQRSKFANATDASWLISPAPNKGTPLSLSVVNDADGLGTGNALFVDNATVPGQITSKSLVASYPTRALAAVGDAVTLSFDFRFTKIAANHLLNSFRFGLYDARTGSPTADLDYKAGHSGYLTSLNFGTLGAVPSQIFENGGEGNVNSGSDVATIASFGNALLAIPVSSSRTSASVTYTRRANGLEIRFHLTNAAGATLLNATALHPAPQWNFNEVVFSTGQSEADYFLDNIRVAYGTGL